ncbi:MAG: hypothetical protein OXT65_07700 [Alphaproteobacteria bacterium]|nr:hypothetical protein [Alphaproteobacteria bacterium]
MRKAEWKIFVCLCLAVFILGTAVTARAADTVPIRFGYHSDYTRVVFDFPKLVAYFVKETEGGYEIKFDTDLAAGTIPRLPRGIAGLSALKSGPNTLVVNLSTKGSRIHHHRLMRMVVVDVYFGQVSDKKKAEKKKEKEKPKEKIALFEPMKKSTSAPKEAEKEEKPLPEAAPEPPLVAAADDEVPPPLPAPVEAVEKEDVPPPTAENQQPEERVLEESTRISISSIEPLHMAVFKRFGMLWIVTDSKQVTVAPQVTGPHADYLGKPRLFKFGDGIAWRYAMPPNTYLGIRKRNLTWHVNLSSQPTGWSAGADVNVDIDRASGKAKLISTLGAVGEVMEFIDPSTGDTLKVVPVSRPDARVDQIRRFPNVEVLPAAAGMVVRPLVEGVLVKRIGSNVLVTAPEGIIVTPYAITGVSTLDGSGNAENVARLFDFPNWRQGGITRLYENKRRLEEGIAAAQTSADRQAMMMRLALLYFANDFGKETLAVLRLIAEEDDKISDSPSFIALKGAASAMAGYYGDARTFLSHPAIQTHPEVRLWMGYTAAASEQWRLADQFFPQSNALLSGYPENLSIPMRIYMAESALRLGRSDTARALLENIRTTSSDFAPRYEAALEYLNGETFRQEGDVDKALEAWQPVADGMDRLYHTKASLALALLKLQEGKSTPQRAIEEVDSLRFAWRGDGLEVQILHSLGLLKVRDKQYLSGLQDMALAAKLSDEQLWDSTPIRDDMRRVFEDVFVGGAVQDISPLEVVSLYEEFSRLVPHGKEADTAKRYFAGYLMRMDLLKRAADVMEDILRAGLPDEDVVKMGAQLSAAYLLDGKPENAIKALERTKKTAATPEQVYERALLKARAHAKMNQMDTALAILHAYDTNEAQQMKMNILWQARRWGAAARAIKPLLPSCDEKMDDMQARLAVNMGVALKLADDTDQLKAVRRCYTSSMQPTALAATFGVVTRPGGITTPSDRETILKMAGEVDMFSAFLESYKTSDATIPAGAQTDG